MPAPEDVTTPETIRNRLLALRGNKPVAATLAAGLVLMLVAGVMMLTVDSGHSAQAAGQPVVEQATSVIEQAAPVAPQVPATRAVEKSVAEKKIWRTRSQRASHATGRHARAKASRGRHGRRIPAASSARLRGRASIKTKNPFE
jgi:hypothetical protein